MNFDCRGRLLASRSIFLLGLLAWTMQMLAADPIVFQSGPKNVQLLELFTSEGCSSCPPAEASLSRLANHPRLWREFVPVAFHVDYWDRLGWKDPFASVESTKRQQTYAEHWKANSVYTPAFVLNGREWHDTSVPAANAKAAGVLKVTVRVDDADVTINFEPVDGAADQFDVYLARVGFGIKINVGAGENNGRSLRHDFVVLSLTHEKLNRATAELHFAPGQQSVTRPARTALAAWVAKSGDITPLQATGGWLP